MTKWLQWIVLTAITGNPLVSIAILLVVWWLVDRFTLGLLPDPFRFTKKWMRARALRRLLGLNPSDRRARLELAMLLVERRRHAEALALVKPNVEAGDDDAGTLFVMAQACLGSGHPEQGEVFLDETMARDPNFRMGEVHLERGRWRLRRGDARGAVEALEALLQVRPGSVEGKVLLSKAYLLLGDDVKAAYAKKDAWNDYVHSPGFQRRRDRFWAWRANPARPVAYAVIALLCGFLLTRFVGPVVRDAVGASAQPTYAWDPWE